MSFVSGLRSTRESNEARRKFDKSRRSQFNGVTVGSSAKVPEADFGASPIDTDVLSGHRLVSRYMTREQVEEAVEDFETMSVTRLLKEVHPPAFDPPAYANYVVMGIVARKSEFRTSSTGKKYLMMWLSDLKFDISLSVYGQAVDKYWKVRPGTLVGVLNPRLYVQKHDTLALGLSIYTDNCMLEIGQAKDLGQCEGITAQNTPDARRCKNWIDVRRACVCDFHQEQRTRQATSKRPEFNSVATKLYDPRAGSGGKRMTVLKGGGVAWKQGLQVDHQVPGERQNRKSSSVINLSGGMPDAPVGRVYIGGGRTFKGDEDSHDRPDAASTRLEAEKRDKRRRDEIKADVTIRKRLASLPDGILLREYDANGDPVHSHLPDINEKTSARAFTPLHIRRIGFNPATLGAAKPRRQPRPTREPVAPANDDSDDDLEIV